MQPREQRCASAIAASLPTFEHRMHANSRLRPCNAPDPTPEPPLLTLMPPSRIVLTLIPPSRIGLHLTLSGWQHTFSSSRI